MGTVSKQVRKELLEALRARYGRASKGGKGTILNEFAMVSGYHRKYTIRLLRSRMEVTSSPAVISQRVYGEAVKNALIVVWEAANGVSECGDI